MDAYLGFDLQTDNDDEPRRPNIHSYECWNAVPHLFSIISSSKDEIMRQQSCPYCGAETMEIEMAYLEAPDGTKFFGITANNLTDN